MDPEALPGDVDRQDRNAAIERHAEPFLQLRAAEPGARIAVVERQRQQLDQAVPEHAIPLGQQPARVRERDEVEILETDLPDRDFRRRKDGPHGDGAVRRRSAGFSDLGQPELLGEPGTDPTMPLRAGVDREAIGALAADRDLDDGNRRALDWNHRALARRRGAGVLRGRRRRRRDGASQPH